VFPAHCSLSLLQDSRCHRDRAAQNSVEPQELLASSRDSLDHAWVVTVTSVAPFDTIASPAGRTTWLFDFSHSWPQRCSCAVATLSVRQRAKKPVLILRLLLWILTLKWKSCRVSFNKSNDAVRSPPTSREPDRSSSDATLLEHPASAAKHSRAGLRRPDSAAVPHPLL
jgi:hypothetical protein